MHVTGTWVTPCWHNIDEQGIIVLKYVFPSTKFGYSGKVTKRWLLKGKPQWNVCTKCWWQCQKNKVDICLIWQWNTANAVIQVCIIWGSAVGLGMLPGGLCLQDCSYCFQGYCQGNNLTCCNEQQCWESDYSRESLEIGCSLTELGFTGSE